MLCNHQFYLRRETSIHYYVTLTLTPCELYTQYSFPGPPSGFHREGLQVDLQLTFTENCNKISSSFRLLFAVL